MVEAEAKRTRPKAVLIAGPTASGKSALALRVAERANGTVVNADSMQVYRELKILTARPSQEDEARVPHRLYGHVSARESYSVAQWLKEAAAALEAARAEGRLPIIVGGTGMFLTALTQGLADMPPVPAAIREEVRARLARDGAARLHGALAACDAVMAGRLRPTDSQRIARALEVWEATGRSLADWQAGPAPPLLKLEETLPLVLVPDRAALYARIDARFERMVGAGALDEVRALAALGLDPAAPALKALGVAPLRAVVAGESPLEAAIARAQTASRQYAKRQMTWFRNKMIAWKNIDTQFLERSVDEIFSNMA